MKRALITGISGQDGSFLTELLLGKGYEIHGIVKLSALHNQHLHLSRLSHLIDKITLYPCSLEDYVGLVSIVEEVQPDECYHLASRSFVTYSFEEDFSIIPTNITYAYNILSSIRHSAPECRFYFAGTSEMFGHATETPQNEMTKFHPRSPYGLSKAAGFFLAENYRETYGLFACSGILYNHESERRGFEFVSRRISNGVAEISLGISDTLRLGNLLARRDWGYAPEFVGAMWLMLQQDNPDDYVISTGVTHSVQEFVEKAFQIVGLSWEKYVIEDPALHRPAEKCDLCGDFSKANEILGWKPTVTFNELIEIMVESDIKRLRESG